MNAAEWGLNYATATYGNTKGRADKLIINGQEIPVTDVQLEIIREQVPGMNIDLWNPPKNMPTTKTVSITTDSSSPASNQIAGIFMDDRDYQIECLRDDLEYLRSRLKEIVGPDDENLTDDELLDMVGKLINDNGDW